MRAQARENQRLKSTTSGDASARKRRPLISKARLLGNWPKIPRDSMQLQNLNLENWLPAPTIALLGTKVYRYIKQGGSSDGRTVTVTRAQMQVMQGNWAARLAGGAAAAAREAGCAGGGQEGRSSCKRDEAAALWQGVQLQTKKKKRCLHLYRWFCCTCVYPHTWPSRTF
jgi:hypothetical protein